MKRKVIAITTALSMSVAATVTWSTPGKPVDESSQSLVVTQVGGPVTPHTTNVDLRNMPKAQTWFPGDPIKEVPRRTYTPVNQVNPQSMDITADALVENQTNYPTRSNRVFTTPLLNQDGQGFSGLNPPDPVLDVGKNYVIHSINGGGGALFEIIDKITGANVAGPIAMESLGTGDCAGGLGDPIILYDETAERWFMQEFSANGNFMCFYISQTDDPVTGGWHHYGFSDTQFPDYPHFGIWPNAYFGAANNGSRPIYAFDRENMLAGNTARPMQKFTLIGLDGFGFQAATPADWDNLPDTNAPPEGAPGIILRHVDEEAHGNSNGINRPNMDYLEMIEFTVDWDTPANSSLNNIDIDISDFNSCFLDLTTFDTVPQPGSGARLDAIREVILNRLQYLNFGTHESLVGVLPTNITDGCNPVQAGLRWFELRRDNPSGNPDLIFADGFDLPSPEPWVLHQEGTYADATAATQNRLVASISMDVSGNIAMAHSITDTDGGSPISASLRYTGRMASDLPGVMSQTETDLVIGSGANTSGRWGDYAAMAVDPLDGCTFYFIGEYQDGANWNTRIGSFRFDACGEPGFALSSPDTNVQVCNMGSSPSGSAVVDVISVGEHAGDVTLAFNPALPAGITGPLTPNPVTIGNSFQFDWTVDQSVVAGPYTATIEGTSPGVDNQTIDINFDVLSSVPGGAATLISPADAAIDISGAAVNYAWDAVAGADSYRIEISDTSDFTNVIENEIVGTNSYTSQVALNSNTTHYWRVTAQNLCGDSLVSTVFSFTTSNEICFTIDTAIPDNDPAGIDGVGTVADLGTVDSLTASVNISHTFVGDLVISLSKGATTVELMNRPGVPAGTFGCGGDDVDAIFDDNSGTPVETVCDDSPAIGGTVAPEQALSAFNGVSLDGDWTLNVNDNAGADTGILNEFCIIPVLQP